MSSKIGVWEVRRLVAFGLDVSVALGFSGACICCCFFFMLVTVFSFLLPALRCLCFVWVFFCSLAQPLLCLSAGGL